MLNCILGMVEKTKRALAILQHRSYADRQDLWRAGRHLDGAPDFDLKKAAPHPHYKTPAAEDARRRTGEGDFCKLTASNWFNFLYD